MKKLLITALVAVMCVGFGATAFAAASEAGAAFTDIAGHDAEFELTALAALGIYSGQEGIGGAVLPDDPITRAEFCKVLVTAAGRGTTAAGLAGLQPTFTDGASIPSWAWGYVNVAVYMGIINGYADGSFGANNPVTYAEAVTMLIRAVSGHAAQVPAGVWPYNYLFYGVDNGFTGPVDVGFANLPATRGDVARMLFATMQVNKLNAKGEELKFDEEVAGSEDTAILAGHYFTGTLTSVDLAGNTCSLGALADKVYLAGAADISGLLMVDVKYVTDASDDIAAIGIDEDATTITGVFDDWDYADDGDYIVLDDETEVEFTDATDWSLNTDDKDAADFDDTEYGLQSGDELVITVDEGGAAAYVFATRFQATDYIVEDGVEASGVDEDGDPYDTEITGDFHGFTVPADCAVTVNGAAADRDSLADYDVFDVALNSSGEAVVLRAYREVVEGTVAGTTTTYPGAVEKVTIEFADETTETYTINDDGYVDLPGEDSKVKYALDGDGKLFVAIDYETLSPFGVCLSYTVNGDGKMYGTFDIRGQEVTYELDDEVIPYCCGYTDVSGGDELASWEEVAALQGYVRLEIDTGSNTVICDESWTVDYECCLHEVVSVDAANGTLTVWDYEDEEFTFINDPDIVVYERNAPDSDTDYTKTYIGLEALKVGDYLWAYDSDWPDDPWDVGCGPVYELTTVEPD